MHPRKFILFLAATLAVALTSSAATPTNSKPNVLLIVVDDLNDYISLLANYPGVKTPNLDKFAKSAMNFTHGYCAAPICNPSRTAFISGVAPYRSGVYDNGTRMTLSKVVTDSVLLPEQFKRNDYHTMWNGKFFHSEPGPQRREQMW